MQNRFRLCHYNFLNNKNIKYYNYYDDMNNNKNDTFGALSFKTIMLQFSDVWIRRLICI